VNVQNLNSMFSVNHYSTLEEAYFNAQPNEVFVQECYNILKTDHCSIKERRKYESETILDMIADGYDPTLTNSEGVSALRLIMEYSLLEDDQIISLLKTIPFEKFPKDIMHSVNSYKIGRYLCRRKCDVNALDAKGNTPLTSAIKRYLEFSKYEEGDPYVDEAESIMKELLTLMIFFRMQKADLNLGLPFHLLVKEKALDLIEILQELRGDIDQRDAIGNTTLMIACLKQRPDKRYSSYIKSLIDLECDPFIKNRFGETPIELIVKGKLLYECEIFDILKKSFQHDKKPFIKKFGCSKVDLIPVLSSLLHHTRSRKIIEFLLDKGVSIDAFDRKGNTALFLAVERLDIDLVEFCLERRADPLLEKPYNKQGKPLLCGASSPMILIQNKTKTCKQLCVNIDSKMIKAKGQSKELDSCLEIQELLAFSIVEMYFS
jgi:ankyrin repeat protein